jgi:hypothetical protein
MMIEEYPMLFEVSNTKHKKTTHCGGGCTSDTYLVINEWRVCTSVCTSGRTSVCARVCTS